MFNTLTYGIPGAAKNIPTELVTGFIVLHAERVIQTSLEAFVVRLYRQTNLVSCVVHYPLKVRNSLPSLTERLLERLLGRAGELQLWTESDARCHEEPLFAAGPSLAPVSRRSFILSHISRLVCLFSTRFSFHEKVQDSLQARKADVVELYQPMSNLMQQIQSAVIECMEATLGELKRSCTNVS